ncbi:DUF6125 family protein [Chloroflexota bacterium]
MMMEMGDYRGEFNPKARFEDFSKDALVKLVKEYARLFALLGGMYDSVIKDKLGFDEASKMSTEVFIGRMIGQHEGPRIARALGIDGDDVLALMKLIQMVPDGTREDLYASDFDVKNNNHVIWTVRECPTLFYYERHGDNKAISACCGMGGQEHQAVEKYRDVINPKIEVIPLKLPPRAKEGDICCQWEYKLES